MLSGKLFLMRGVICF